MPWSSRDQSEEVLDILDLDRDPLEQMLVLAKRKWHLPLKPSAHRSSRRLGLS
jgi:hypothetical protein